MRASNDAVPPMPGPVITGKRRQQLITDNLCASMSEIMQQRISVLPGGRFLSQDGACAMVTGIPAASLNVVWCERPNPNIAAVAALLGEVSRPGVPYSLRLRPGCDAAFGTLAASRGMALAGEVTLMAMDTAVPAAAIPVPAGLAIGRLSPDQAPRHADLVALGFGIARDVVRRAVSPDLLRLDSAACYVAEYAGEPVTTGLSMTLGGFTGVFNVTTVPGFRGRGFGAAVTARAVADGLAAGSRWCWLEATAAALPIYRRIGFRDVEARQHWEARRH